MQPYPPKDPEDASGGASPSPAKRAIATPNAAEKAKARIYAVCSDELQEFSAMFEDAVSKLASAVSALEAASASAELLQQRLQLRWSSASSTESEQTAVRNVRQRLAQTIKVSALVKTVNAARMHLTKLHRWSKLAVDSVRRDPDGLIGSDRVSVFE